MATSSDALFSHLLEDLSPYLSAKDFHNLLRKEKVPLTYERGINHCAAVSLGNAFYAKYVGDASTPAAESAAFGKFTAMNNHCERYRLDPTQLNSWDDEVMGELKSSLYRLLYPTGTTTYDLFEILDFARNGPGASVGSFGADSYTKLFASRGAQTGDLFGYLKYHFSSDHRWQTALNLRLAVFGYPETVGGSKLMFVPKNRDIMRSICTEPSLNMFYQLGLGSILEDRLLRSTGIDLSCQPSRNRELARLGSIDGGYATIDLASASDTISLNLLREILPREFFNVLLRLRSPVTSYKGATIPLHMVSTMGNGFTFPLQTIIFTCCVLAIYSVYGIPRRDPSGFSVGNWGVFGDDIVVEAKAFRPLVLLLGRLGFFVNTGKSFDKGPFRESCGEDYLSGVNIRGVYCKTLDSPQSLMVLVNRLNDYTARTGIPLRRTVAYLVKQFRFNPVPLYENDDSGVRVPLRMLNAVKRDKHVQSIRYTRWVSGSKDLVIDSEAGLIRTPRGSKYRIFNPEGLMLEFLRSGLRESRIGIRRDVSAYTRRTGISPNWDYLPTGLGMQSSRQCYRLPLPRAIEINLPG
jgi:hypothetical protein